MPQEASPTNPKPELVDVNQRYDVYCSERNQEIVVYRNALFKGVKKLFQSHAHDPTVEFVELEQANGDVIFLARFSIIKFCAHGATPDAEPLGGKEA